MPQVFSFQQASSDRWLTMNAENIDKDGGIAILLRNAKFPLGQVPDRLMKKWNNYSPSLIILKNKGKIHKMILLKLDHTNH